jgi:predicted RNA-binding protein with RPS1 domain
MIVCENKNCYFRNTIGLCGSAILSIDEKGKCNYFLSREKYEKERNSVSKEEYEENIRKIALEEKRKNSLPKVSKSLCNKLKKEKI